MGLARSRSARVGPRCSGQVHRGHATPPVYVPRSLTGCRLGAIFVVSARDPSTAGRAASKTDVAAPCSIVFTGGIRRHRGSRRLVPPRARFEIRCPGGKKAVCCTHPAYDRHISTDTTPPKHSPRSYGMAWSIGGWLLMSFLQSRRRDDWTTEARVAAELTTTFASTYTREVSLAGMLKPDAFTSYVKRATGEKFLLTPQTLP